MCSTVAGSTSWEGACILQSRTQGQDLTLGAQLHVHWGTAHTLTPCLYECNSERGPIERLTGLGLVCQANNTAERVVFEQCASKSGGKNVGKLGTRVVPLEGLPRMFLGLVFTG